MTQLDKKSLSAPTKLICRYDFNIKSAKKSSCVKPKLCATHGSPIPGGKVLLFYEKVLLLVASRPILKNSWREYSLCEEIFGYRLMDKKMDKIVSVKNMDKKMYKKICVCKISRSNKIEISKEIYDLREFF